MIKEYLISYIKNGRKALPFFRSGPVAIQRFKLFKGTAYFFATILASSNFA
jgi:hypothetical protein